MIIVFAGHGCVCVCVRAPGGECDGGLIKTIVRSNYLIRYALDGWRKFGNVYTYMENLCVR